jgi:hypothetical protein
MVFDEQTEIAAGLHTLLRTTQSYTEALPQKLGAMEGIYLRSNPTLYDDTEEQRLQYFREAFCYKFYVATMHLEQLWALTYNRRDDFSLEQVLSNIFDNHKTSDEDLLLYSFALEAFIVQGNAFLDFYMLYVCCVFQIQETSYFPGKKLLKALQQIQRAPFAARARSVREYLAKNVLGDGTEKVFLTNNWGELLRSLRNSILHRDALAPSFKDGETLLQKLIGKWPASLRRTNCSRFCQDVQNVMFFLATELAATIYGIEWKPGPYRSGLWA